MLLDEDGFAAELRRNVVSAFTAIKHCVPAMTAAGGGSIVCISSDAATMSWPFMASVLRRQGRPGRPGPGGRRRARLAQHPGQRGAAGPHPDNSNNVSLLFTDPELIAAFVEQKPLGRTGTPEDIAAGVRYLAGPGVGLGHRPEPGHRGGQRAAPGPVAREGGPLPAG